MSRVRVAIAGSTGSIGTQTIDVVRAEADRYEVVALAAGSSVDAAHRPGAPSCTRRSSPSPTPPAARRRPGPSWHRRGRRPRRRRRAGRRRGQRRRRLRRPARHHGDAAAGKRLALANKESLIVAGPVVQPLRSRPAPSWSRWTASTPRSTRPALQRRSTTRGRPDRPHRQRRAVPLGRSADASWPTSPSSRPSPIRRGRWARRSRSTRPR